jgi:hypothetical protein
MGMLFDRNDLKPKLVDLAVKLQQFSEEGVSSATRKMA